MSRLALPRMRAGWLRALAGVAAAVLSAGSARGYEAEAGALKLDADASAKLRAVLRFDDGTPTEYPTFDLGLHAEAALGSKAKIVTRTLMRSDGTVLDPSNEHNVHDFRSVFQDSTPYVEFEEAYLDLELPASALRAGIQKFAWGKLDAQNPTDRLNPAEFTRPLDEIESASKIGIPAVDFKFIPDQVTSTGPFEMMVLEGVFLPIAGSFRLPTEEERWYPPLLRIPQEVIVDPGLLSDEPPFNRLSPFPVTTNLTVSEGEALSISANHLQWAGQWSAFVGGFDVDLSYFDGYDTIPTGELSGTMTSFSPGLGTPPTVTADMVFTPRLDRIRLFGGGFSTSAWDLTIKGNFAYIQGRRFNYDISTDTLFTNPNFVDFQPLVEQFLADFPEQYFNQTLPIPAIPISVERDTVNSGLQVEYVTGDWIFDVVGYLDVMLDPVPGLIQEQLEGRLLLQMRRSFLRETLTVDLTSVWIMARGEFVVMPKLGYQVLDGLTAEAGVLVIEGPDDGLLGQFRRNDEAFANVVYAWQ
ncbi:MAG: hypothetical protein IPK07_35495 [Deltaproteobacteria bacterium]|nr:hypothetical protein [Deltaproteobacteria bacterium]